MATKPKTPAPAGATAKAPKEKPKEADTPTVEEPNEPSPLDELTHRELLNLFDESSRTILFAKAQQWKTVGSTLAIYLVLVALARYVSAAPAYVSYLEIFVFLATPAAWLILIIYQFWQHTELSKLQAASVNFSSIYRRIRRIKSGREANLHRYILFGFMAGIILMGGVLTLLSFRSIH
jgi:hypothetical protein